MKFNLIFLVLFSLFLGNQSSEIEFDEYGCINNYLQSIGMLQSFNATKVNDKFVCSEVIKAFKNRITSTYYRIFEINQSTQSEANCIMSNLKNSKTSDFVLQKFAYENLRNNDDIEKATYCKVLKETDEAIEREMKKSVVPCVPDFKMENFFDADSAAEECHDEEKQN